MKIDFYWFNVDTPIGYSYGVALLSKELKDRGHEVRLRQVDERVALPWDPPALAAGSVAFGADIVAISFNSSHVRHARALIDALREVDPDVRVVVGGSHPTLAPDEVIAWPGVDALGRAECDGRLADFVDAWAEGIEAPAVENFWVKRADASVLRNPLGLPPRLDGVAPFDEAIDLPRLVAANRGLGDVTVTRGCPYRCTYCHNKAILDRYIEETGLKMSQLGYCRRRTVDDAIAEILRLKRLARGEIRILNFDDDTLLTDRAWFLELIRRLHRDVGLPYVVNGTVDRIDETTAAALAETGCLLIRFGVESGSQRILREVLHRGRPLDGVPEAFGLLREHGVNTRAYVMVGIPTETREELMETFQLCGRAQTDTIRPAYLHPYPGTEIHERCVRDGIIRDDVELTSYFEDSPLRWEPEHALFLRKVMVIHPWLSTLALPGAPAARRYRALLDEALAMDAASWGDPLARAALRREELALDRELRRAGVPHYLSPFPDRPDAAFLIRPDRRQRFPNIDDAWPPDAPWRDEPLP